MDIIMLWSIYSYYWQSPTCQGRSSFSNPIDIYVELDRACACSTFSPTHGKHSDNHRDSIPLDLYIGSFKRVFVSVFSNDDILL